MRIHARECCLIDDINNTDQITTRSAFTMQEQCKQKNKKEKAQCSTKKTSECEVVYCGGCLRKCAYDDVTDTNNWNEQILCYIYTFIVYA